MDFPDDAFRAETAGSGSIGFVKFVIQVCDPSTVYFFDNALYPFHYDFVTAELDPYLGIGLSEFESKSLFNDGRELLLGAVVMPPLSGFPPTSEFAEYGIQLVGNDALDPAAAVAALQSVANGIAAGPGVQSFYFPTFEQNESAQDNAGLFSANNFPLSSTARWTTANTCYSRGWALGRLKFVTASEIEDAFEAGDLRPEDVLLTDGIPAEIPSVAGVLTLAPATPNSHVAILANTFQIPFAYLGLAADAERAQELVGRRIVLRCQGSNIFSVIDELRMIDAENVPDALVQQILQLKQPKPLELLPTQDLGAYYLDVDPLTPLDIATVGGKAANFGFLRRAIPADSPRALGLSFDLWEEFLDQPMGAGLSLRESIADLLSGEIYPPVDTSDLFDRLKTIRDWIEDDATFTAAQEASIVAILQDPAFGFDSSAKLRFRSSTNVEDAAQFTGAGLYESKSGCLLDDLDGDLVGPSVCELDEPDEKGVFRAIKKVYASFYNDNAYLERLRHNVDEDQVGMAVLVHHNFPDPLEAANGVATVEVSPFSATELRLVTQLGAVSVTNPEGSAQPEVVEINHFAPSVPFPVLTEPSSLVQLGDEVMEFPADYIELAQLLLAVSDQYALETGKNDYILDFEYKLMVPGGAVKPAGGLVVKQVREIPQPNTVPSITPFIIDEATDYVVLQGRSGGSVFANHRLKSEWTLRSRNMLLSESNLQARGILRRLRTEFNDGCLPALISGKVEQLPAYMHAWDGSTSSDSWQLNRLNNPRSYSLEATGFSGLVSEAQSPVLTLHDLQEFGLAGILKLRVEHSEAVPFADFLGDLGQTTTDEVILTTPFGGPGDPFHSQQFSSPGGVTITIQYRLSPPDFGFCAGCIFPLSKWEGTTIEGLTTDPIVLQSNLSQSYEAGQHNFTEQFLLEPRLEPGVSALALTQLRDRNIGSIYISTGFTGFSVEFLDFNGCPTPQSPPWSKVPLEVLSGGLSSEY